MAGLRLSTDILSPVNSEFSINDESLLSFECSAGTPDFEKHLKSLGNKTKQKGSSFKLFSKNATPGKEDSFEMILSDIKRQADINAEKEEKCRDTYEQLKQSMDDLFYGKTSDSDASSSITKQVNLESISNAENTTCRSQTKKVKEKEHILEVATKTCSPSTMEYILEAPIKKVQENPNKTKQVGKSNHPSKNEPHSKESAKASRNKVNVKSEKDMKSRDGNHKSRRLKTTGSSSSAQTSETTKENKEAQSLMSQFSSRKRDVPLPMPSMENKAISIERSVQIAIGMQLDGIRNLMLDQNISLRKEMFILQEIARKQNKETGYLLSVVEELLERNKKLISKRD